MRTTALLASACFVGLGLAPFTRAWCGSSTVGARSIDCLSDRHVPAETDARPNPGKRVSAAADVRPASRASLPRLTDMPEPLLLLSKAAELIRWPPFPSDTICSGRMRRHSGSPSSTVASSGFGPALMRRGISADAPVEAATDGALDAPGRSISPPLRPHPHHRRRSERVP